MLSNPSLSSEDIKLGYPVIKAWDLDSMINFYVEKLGLRLLKEREGIVYLAPTGSNEALLALQRSESKAYSSQNEAGLYHFAILLPTRQELASTLAALQERGVILDGFADHIVSEALYLQDPEGNGIEIYSDRPRSAWKFDSEGRIIMGTLPLNLESLLSELKGRPSPLSSNARIGHFHLKVTNVKKSSDFYINNLSLSITSIWHNAAFLSIGGYHHHFGLNSWLTYNGIKKRVNTTGLSSLKIYGSKKYFESIGKTDENNLTIIDPDNITISLERIS